MKFKALAKKMYAFGKKHRKIIVKIILSFLLALFFVFGIPLVINHLYKKTATISIFAMEWEASDALSFYGSILGAAATIYVLQQTIQFTLRNQKEERRLAIKPYLETIKYNHTDVTEINDDGNIVFLSVTKNLIAYQGDLPDNIRSIRTREWKLLKGQQKDPFTQISLEREIAAYFANHYLLSYEIQNCGAGNAINVKFCIDGKSTIPGFCVTLGKTKKFLIVFNADLLDAGDCEMVFTLTYSDISSFGKYEQTERIKLYKENSIMKTKQTVGDLLTTPIEIGKEDL